MKRFFMLCSSLALTGLLTVSCVDKAALGIGVAPVAAETAKTENAPSPSSGNIVTGPAEQITIDCSVSLLDFSTALAEGYVAAADVTSKAVGQETALQSVADGASDFALFGGYAEDLEEYTGLTSEVIGAEVIRLISGTAGGRADVTLDEMFTLFISEESFGFYEEDTAESGTSDAIALTAPGTATRILFEELFELRGDVGGVRQSLIPETENEFATDAEVIDFVAANPETVGVINEQSLTGAVTGLTLDGIAPDSADYIGKRDVILAYQPGNTKAEAFIAFVKSAEADDIFGTNGISR